MFVRTHFFSKLAFLITIFSISTLGMEDCLSYFFLSKSNRVIRKEELAFEPKVEWYEMSASDYLNIEGRTINLSRDRKFLKLPAVTQEVLLIDKYSKEERALIEKIWDLSHLQKFQSEDFKRKFDEKYLYYSSLANKYNSKFEIAEQEIRNIAKESALKSPGVEVGAWIIYLKSGSPVTALHTSRHSERIESIDISNALNGVLNSKNIKREHIAEIRYFHTHPHGGPLSIGDHDTSLELVNSFKSEGINVPFHIYAISMLDDLMLTFHSSYL